MKWLSCRALGGKLQASVRTVMASAIAVASSLTTAYFSSLLESATGRGEQQLACLSVIALLYRRMLRGDLDVAQSAL
jgi:hypothetical protein